IATKVPGVRFGEHLPRLARLADRFTVLRTLSHDDLDHGTAAYLALTGHPHTKKSANPPPAPGDLPTLGAVLHRVRPAREQPDARVHPNGPLLIPELVGPGQFAGLLGRACEPLVLGDVSGGAVAVPGLTVPPDLLGERRESRRELLASLEKGC